MSDSEEQEMGLMGATEDSEVIYAEPPFLRPLVRTSHVFDAVRTEPRPTQNLEFQKSGDETEVASFECTQAIEQSWLPFLPGNCFTSREEMTHGITITTKRVQVLLDEASGCWPSTEEDHTRVGHSLCCLCGCAPFGRMQSKCMSLGDVAGYEREMTVPRIQVLSTYRMALSLWAMSILLTFLYCVCVGDPEVNQAIKDHASYLNSAQAGWTGIVFPAPSAQFTDQQLLDQNPPSKVLLSGGAALVVVTMLAYVVLDRLLTWGTRAVGVMLAIAAPVVVFTLHNIELFEAKYYEANASLEPYECLFVVFQICHKAALLLPVWVVIGKLYLTYCGIRTYRLTLNFANQVSYTLHLKREQVDAAIDAMAPLLGNGKVVEAVDVAGAGLLSSEVDMPLAIPGSQIEDGAIDFAAGGGAKITNCAIAHHKEEYAYYFGGPETKQLSRVFMHSPRATCSPVTKMIFTTNPIPYHLRNVTYFLGFLLVVNGLLNFFANDQNIYEHDAIKAEETPFGLGVKACGYWLLAGFGILLTPVLSGCCYGKLDVEFTWGVGALSFQTTYEPAELFMSTLLMSTAVAASSWISPDRAKWPEEEEIGEWVEEQAGCLSCAEPRKLRITSHRIAIQQGGSTTVTYWRTGLTEADLGPLEWCDPCCALTPVAGWRRPSEGDLVKLSLNFGWGRAVTPVEALPGTELQATEQLALTFEDAEEVMRKLDSVIGNYAHHVWSPDRINW